MRFAADWLALRAPADGRSRSARLMAAAASEAVRRAGGEPVRILDLGAGTGAMARALAPAISGAQQWTLVDSDGALLAEAERLLPAAAPDLSVVTRVCDLRDALAGEAPPHLVTASALFDIASAEVIRALAQRLAASRTPLLAVLTYDGRKSVRPADPRDPSMLAAFNAHQRRAKTLGAAAGPDAPAILADALAAVGAEVLTEDSAWHLTRAGDGALIDAMLDGWADAAAEERPDDAGAIAAWREAHRGAAAMHVGHVDLFARFGA